MYILPLNLQCHQATWRNIIMSDETVSGMSSLFEDAMDGSTSSSKATIDSLSVINRCAWGQSCVASNLLGCFFFRSQTSWSLLYPQLHITQISPWLPTWMGFSSALPWLSWLWYRNMWLWGWFQVLHNSSPIWLPVSSWLMWEIMARQRKGSR